MSRVILSLPPLTWTASGYAGDGVIWRASGFPHRIKPVRASGWTAYYFRNEPQHRGAYRTRRIGKL